MRVVIDPIAWPLIWVSLTLAAVSLMCSLIAKRLGQRGLYAWCAAAGALQALALWVRTGVPHGQEQQNIQTWWTYLFLLGAVVCCYGGWHHYRRFATRGR